MSGGGDGCGPLLHQLSLSTFFFSSPVLFWPDETKQSSPIFTAIFSLPGLYQLFQLKGSLHEWNFRAQLDRFAAPAGMVIGLLYVMYVEQNKPPKATSKPAAEKAQAEPTAEASSAKVTEEKVQPPAATDMATVDLSDADKTAVKTSEAATPTTPDPAPAAPPPPAGCLLLTPTALKRMRPWLCAASAALWIYYLVYAMSCANKVCFGRGTQSSARISRPLTHSKVECNALHSLVSPLLIVAFLVLRNATMWLRGHYSWFFAAVGKVCADGMIPFCFFDSHLPFSTSYPRFRSLLSCS